MIEIFFFSLALFTRLTYLGGRGGFWHLPGFLLSHAELSDSNSLIASSIITIMIIPRESETLSKAEPSEEKI